MNPPCSGLSAFIVALAQVFGTGCAVVIVDRVGRKVLLLISDAVMGISILALSVFFYLKDHAEVICPETVSWHDSSDNNNLNINE